MGVVNKYSVQRYNNVEPSNNSLSQVVLFKKIVNCNICCNKSTKNNFVIKQYIEGNPFELLSVSIKHSSQNYFLIPNVWEFFPAKGIFREQLRCFTAYQDRIVVNNFPRWTERACCTCLRCRHVFFGCFEVRFLLSPWAPCVLSVQSLIIAVCVALRVYSCGDCVNLRNPSIPRPRPQPMFTVGYFSFHHTKRVFNHRWKRLAPL